MRETLLLLLQHYDDCVLVSSRLWRDAFEPVAVRQLLARGRGRQLLRHSLHQHHHISRLHHWASHRGHDSETFPQAGGRNHH